MHCGVSEECLGRARKKQPDWFLDAINRLMPLVTAKRRAYSRFLHAHTTSSKVFRQHQRIVKKATDEAKEG